MLVDNSNFISEINCVFYSFLGLIYSSQCCKLLIYHSIKAPIYSVSEFVCVLCSLSPPKRQIPRPEILRDDSPWDWEGFRLKNIRIRRTVSRKMKKKLELVQCALYDLHTLYISFFPFSYYTPFLAKFVNHVEGGSNPG